MSAHAYADFQGNSFHGFFQPTLLDRYLYRGKRRKPRGLRRLWLFMEYVWNLNW